MCTRVNNVNYHCGLLKLTISKKNNAQRSSVHTDMGSLQCSMKMPPANQKHHGIRDNDGHTSQDEDCQ